MGVRFSTSFFFLDELANHLGMLFWCASFFRSFIIIQMKDSSRNKRQVSPVFQNMDSPTRHRGPLGHMVAEFDELFVKMSTLDCYFHARLFLGAS